MECEAFDDLAATRNSAQMRLEKGRHHDIPEATERNI
jgi:hypothetical protein